MRVRNKTESDVFVTGYGNLSAEEEATVSQSESVKQMIKQGVLTEVKPPADKKEGDD